MLRICAALGITLALSSSPALAFDPYPAPPANSKWTTDDVLLSEHAGEFQLSPDCRWVVWTRSVPDKEKGEAVSNIVRASLTGKQEVELTRGTENCTSPRWSPDGRHIAFLTARQPPKAKPAPGGDDKDDAEEKAKPQLWLINPFGGEPWPLTELSRGINSFEWADADTLVFAAQEAPTLHEKTIKDDKKDTSVIVEDEPHAPPVRLFKVSVKTKKVTRLTQNSDRIESFALSPDGRRAVTVHDRSLRFVYDHRLKPLVFLYDLETGNRKQIFEQPRYNVIRVRWAREGKGFYAASTFTNHPRYVNATITELYYFDLATANPMKVDLGWEKGLSHTLTDAQPAFDVTSDGVVALLANGARNRAARYWRVGSLWQHEWLAGAHAQHIGELQVGKDNQTLLYAYSTASTPPQWYTAHLVGDRLAGALQVTDLNSDLAKKAPSVTELVYWKGALDEEVEGVLYYPHNYHPGKKYPLVVMIHGGPAWLDMDVWNDSWHDPINLVTDRGAFAFKPNYHGSLNYGLKWAESLADGKYYDLPLADIEKGVDALLARGLVDPNRLATMGWSNGAILSMALVVRTPRYRAAAAGAGGAEWVGDWGACEFGASFSNYYFGKSPLEDPLLYIKMSPFYQFDRVRTPTLLFQGTEDRNVPPHHGWMQYRALQQLGKTDVRLVLFPGEPHSLKKLIHQRRKVEEELAWFDRYLFKSADEEHEALKPDSPLALALKCKGVKRSGHCYGVQVKGHLVPETIRYEGLEVGRFEVTRAQYAQFDKDNRVVTGKENYPACGVSFEQAKAYCAWLSRLTGQTYRLPTAAEAAKLYDKPAASENTLDYWAGYAVNPDDAVRLRARLKELDGPAPLLKEVGSFKGLGEDFIFDLGGNVAEWVVTREGKGQPQGGSADTPADTQQQTRQPAQEYIGFRVVKG
jgi:dipeptidyl aminopeptidase/acylaminoacyl peptidase